MITRTLLVFALVLAGCSSGDGGERRHPASPPRSDPPDPGYAASGSGYGFSCFQEPVCERGRQLHSLAEKAGFQVVDNTGGALVVKKEPIAFYLWFTHARGGLLRAGKYLTAEGKVGDVAVFRQPPRLAWRVEDFIFWVQAGPLEGAADPTVATLAPLIAATVETPLH